MEEVSALLRCAIESGTSCLSSLVGDDVVDFLQVENSLKINRHMHPANASLATAHLHKAGILHKVSSLLFKRCELHDIKDSCSFGSSEGTTVLVLLIGLCAAILTIICTFTFFREDKEEQITPLCPQLVVKDAELNFKLPLGIEAESMNVTDRKGESFCKVSLDWPDPFRPVASGVAATVRLQSCSGGTTLATVVARNVAVVGQGLALCRSGHEIFGFVEPEIDRRYHVRHRTGVHLLTLFGDFDAVSIEGINPVGSKVCSIQKSTDGIVYGRVLQHFDAGLVICALLATHVHRRLSQASPAQNYAGAWDPTAGLYRPVFSPPHPDPSGSFTAADRPGETTAAAEAEAEGAGSATTASPQASGRGSGADQPAAANTMLTAAAKSRSSPSGSA
mmetsp:Transcript_75906/g.138325  ORF Transcript_75906/g.138325 Transcript_75906/m.138325 type:complete len:392 (-) Transcript_75906:31-1206(-)